MTCKALWLSKNFKLKSSACFSRRDPSSNSAQPNPNSLCANLVWGPAVLSLPLQKTELGCVLREKKLEDKYERHLWCWFESSSILEFCWMSWLPP